MTSSITGVDTVDLTVGSPEMHAVRESLFPEPAAKAQLQQRSDNKATSQTHPLVARRGGAACSTSDWQCLLCRLA